MKEDQRLVQTRGSRCETSEGKNVITNDDDDLVPLITVALLSLIQSAPREMKGSKGLVIAKLPRCLHPVRRNAILDLFVWISVEDPRSQPEELKLVAVVGD